MACCIRRRWRRSKRRTDLSGGGGAPAEPTAPTAGTPPPRPPPPRPPPPPPAQRVGSPRSPASRILKFRPPGRLAVELRQAGLGGLGLARSRKGLEHPFQTHHRLLRLAFLQPGFRHGQVQAAEPIAQGFTRLPHPFRVALDLAQELGCLDPLGQIGIRRGQHLAAVHAAQILLRAIILAGLGE